MTTIISDYKITHHADLDVCYLLWVKNENNVWIHDSWHKTEKNAIQQANDIGLYIRHSQGENQ
jgi:hypothetical protein